MLLLKTQSVRKTVDKENGHLGQLGMGKADWIYSEKRKGVPVSVQRIE